MSTSGWPLDLCRYGWNFAAPQELIEKCAGMDGTWGLKKEYFHLSFKVAEPLLKAIREAEPNTVVSDCPLAALQIEQGLGMTPQHPMEILAAAYGLEDTERRETQWENEQAS